MATKPASKVVGYSASETVPPGAEYLCTVLLDSFEGPPTMPVHYFRVPVRAGLGSVPPRAADAGAGGGGEG